jgi:phosphotransferase system HPr-like phosphotransfer protein
MGRASYAIIQNADKWSILHNGDTEGEYDTKEAAFESAVAAASLAIREGHEVLVSAPSHVAGNGTALGAKDNA